MQNELDNETLILLAEEKIFLGKELIESLEGFKNIPGVQKIQRKINQEIKFLQKVIVITNFSHLYLIIQYVDIIQ